MDYMHYLQSAGGEEYVYLCPGRPTSLDKFHNACLYFKPGVHATAQFLSNVNAVART